jgi:prepilin signal peptidase PulO-like enzyme (type II secretory pathway)
MTSPEQNVSADKPTFTRESALKLAAGGVLAGASYLAAGFSSPYVLYVFYAAYIIALASVAYSDFRARRIPNRIIYPAILVALGAMFHCPGWDNAPLLGGAVAALIFILPVFIYGPERAGVGDVKLAFFIGLIFGFSMNLLWALLVGSGSAALVGLVGILLRKMSSKSLLPFGSFLALGAIALLITQMAR